MLKRPSLPRGVVVLAFFLLAGFIGIQFVRPALVNPPVTAEIQAPAEVRNILRRSCYDCHSNESNLRWFDRINPGYWVVVLDVKQARQHLNFSEIGAKPAAQQKAALFEAVNMIQMGAMPLPSYAFVHRGTSIAPQDLAILRSYLLASTGPVPTISSIVSPDNPGNAEGTLATSKRNVLPAPNGVPFPTDYNHWQVVSSSDRFDNHTMREILGNDVAVKAISDHQINPWPDGTIFAKVAWQQQADSTGVVHAGQFVQVEFMIRDSRKYASTKGWGWARWRGTDLKPYGASADFSNECIACHTPVGKNDFVYTEPIEREHGQ